MTNLKDEAMDYEPTQTKNIADLDSVPVDIDVKQEDFEHEGKQVIIKVIEVDGEKYRVPKSVLKSLKAILEENPDLKNFKVKKSGEGLGTVYTVIPLA